MTVTNNTEQAVSCAISRTREFFFNHQTPDGYWVAELEGDALLQSEAILLLTFLGDTVDGEYSELVHGCARRLLDTQFPDGGWGQFTGGPSDICNTVKAYFALKILGHDPNAEYMLRAKNRALALGGAEKANSFTRFYMALLGQIPYSVIPAVPPQMMLLPKWFPLTVNDMSAWSRPIFTPLSIVSALQPVKNLPPEKGITELFARPPEKWGPLVAPGKKFSHNPFSWDFFFRRCNDVMLFCRKIGVTPFRKAGIKKALEWTKEHFKNSDGPGAIQPPIVWAWIALKITGHADNSEEVQYCRKQFMDLVIWSEDKKSARLQPCKSPVWDTSLTTKALLAGGLPRTNPAIQKALDWIRSQQILRSGDWQHSVTRGGGEVPPGGWCFEFHNDFYPDCDDTAMALMVLAGEFDGIPSPSQKPERGVSALTEHTQYGDDTSFPAGVGADHASINRGLNWLFAMQCSDGGWAAFDKDNNKEMLCAVPFADHNAMIDPSTPDLTGRVLESLGRLGFLVGQNTGPNNGVDRAAEFMRRKQLSDGSWFGRWGVNYIYGTWQALTGLTAVGISPNDSMIRAGAKWLLDHQDQATGGWGESPASYEHPALHGQGTPTASQTAWAVMGLIAAGESRHPAVERGIQFLIERQREDGTWNEPEFTGTGFPLVFYLKYHYYSVYFPLTALSLYAVKTGINLDNCVTDPTDAPRVFAPEKGEHYHNQR